MRERGERRGGGWGVKSVQPRPRRPVHVDNDRDGRPDRPDPGRVEAQARLRRLRRLLPQPPPIRRNSEFKEKKDRLGLSVPFLNFVYK